MPPISEKPVALVTGGARGIGFGIALELARKGFNLAINASRPRPQDEVDAILNPLKQLGAQAIYTPCDIGNLDAHQSMLDAINESFGRMDALVNNAGVAPSTRADILDAEPESFDRLIGINLKGPYFLTQRVANWMIDLRKEGQPLAGKPAQVVNVSSISATVASVNRGDYCLSKAGVAMSSQLWSARLAEFGIGVYEVRPGVIKTDMTSGVTDKYDKLIAEGLTCDPRWGTPQDVGRAVAVLAGGEITYATGSVIMVDGGLTLQRL